MDKLKILNSIDKKSQEGKITFDPIIEYVEENDVWKFIDTLKNKT